MRIIRGMRHFFEQREEALTVALTPRWGLEAAQLAARIRLDNLRAWLCGGPALAFFAWAGFGGGLIVWAATGVCWLGVFWFLSRSFLTMPRMYAARRAHAQRVTGLAATNRRSAGD